MQSVKVNLPDGPLLITPGTPSTAEPQTFTVKDGSVSVADGRADELTELLPASALIFDAPASSTASSTSTASSGSK